MEKIERLKVGASDDWRSFFIMNRTILILLLIIFSSSLTEAADWSLPLSIQSGTAKTSLTLAVQSGASNGFDAGKDVPGRPYEDDLLYASFPHPEWGLNVGGEDVYGFSRDSRGGLPQEFILEVISKQPQVTLSWSLASLPEKTSLLLKNPTSGETVDMSSRASFTFNPGGTSPVQLSIQVLQGDISPPSSPDGVRVEERENSLFISWDRNSDEDTAGYKVHFGNDSTTYTRSINVRDVTNYSLFNLSKDEIYYIAITAYDEEGNESSYSSEVTGNYSLPEDPSSEDIPKEDTTGEDTTSEVALGDDTSGRSQQTTSAPDVPDNENVLPIENDEKKTQTVVSGWILPDLQDDKKEKSSSERRRTTEKRKKKNDETETTGTKDVRGQEPGTNSPGAESVSNKAGSHRLKLDEHPWKLMTIPLQVPLDKPFAEFVALSAEMNRLTGWDSELQSYRRMKYPRPGTAFWLKAGKGYAVLEGQPYRGKEARFTLVKGWNLLGSPYLEVVPFQQARIMLDDSFLTLSKAVKSGLLAKDLQSYVSGAFVHESLDKKGQLKPWRGYWIFARQSCELILYSGAVPEARPTIVTPEKKPPSQATPTAGKTKSESLKSE